MILYVSRYSQAARHDHTKPKSIAKGKYVSYGVQASELR
jgi:hypothetical protein